MAQYNPFWVSRANDSSVKLCQAGSIDRFHVIDDTDVADTITYLPKD
jgi:hypothetical protein